MTQSNRGFDFLRVSLETRITVPAFLLVTAALDADGTTLVASGLAESFARAGQRTLLVTDVRSTLAGRSRGNLTCATLESLMVDAGTGRPAPAAVFGRLREAYAIVVVDAEPLPDSSFAYELASISDGVLVALRLGRKPEDGDRRTIDLLAACGANVLGIVPTTGNARLPATSASATVADAEAEVRPLRTQSVEIGR